MSPDLPSGAVALLLSFTPAGAKKGGAQTRRLLDTLNTPIVVLAVIVVFVTLNGLLFFGYYLPKTNAAPASSPQTERTTGATTSERTHPTTAVEETRPRETQPREIEPKETPPRKTPEETTAASPTATATASPTATATATASP